MADGSYMVLNGSQVRQMLSADNGGLGLKDYSDRATGFLFNIL
jgi:hypothetical protein